MVPIILFSTYRSGYKKEKRNKRKKQNMADKIIAVCNMTS